MPAAAMLGTVDMPRGDGDPVRRVAMWLLAAHLAPAALVVLAITLAAMACHALWGGLGLGPPARIAERSAGREPGIAGGR